MEDSTTRRVLSFLGGQSAPPSVYGHGRRLLYRCPSCQRTWLMDGRASRLLAGPGELAQLCRELSADVRVLPPATCRLCAFTLGAGVFEIDEYGGGRGGYGFNWEGSEPVGAHLLGGILANAWARQQGEDGLVADVVFSAATARAVLCWLRDLGDFPCVYMLGEEDSRAIADGTLPGHGMSGTEGWRWKGGLFSLHCPPLGDDVTVTLAIALPAEEPLDLSLLVRSWQLLAARAARGGITGG